MTRSHSQRYIFSTESGLESLCTEKVGFQIVLNWKKGDDEIKWIRVIFVEITLFIRRYGEQ